MNDYSALYSCTDITPKDKFCLFCNEIYESRKKFVVEATGENLPDLPLRKVKIFSGRKNEDGSPATITVNGILLCMLHMKLRCVLVLFGLIIKKLPEYINGERKTIVIEKAMRKCKGLELFQFRDKTFQPIADIFENESLPAEMPYMNGKQVNIFLKNFESILKSIVKDEDLLVLHHINVIFIFLMGPSKQHSFPSFNKKLYCKIVQSYTLLLLKLFPSNSYGFYTHILIRHSKYMFDLYPQGFAQHTNEGVENLHCKIELLKKLTSASSDLSIWAQIVILILRPILIRKRHEMKWRNCPGTIKARNEKNRLDSIIRTNHVSLHNFLVTVSNHEVETEPDGEDTNYPANYSFDDENECDVSARNAAEEILKLQQQRNQTMSTSEC